MNDMEVNNENGDEETDEDDKSMTTEQAQLRAKYIMYQKKKEENIESNKALMEKIKADSSYKALVDGMKRSEGKRKTHVTIRSAVAHDLRVLIQIWFTSGEASPSISTVQSCSSNAEVPEVIDSDAAVVSEKVLVDLSTKKDAEKPKSVAFVCNTKVAVEVCNEVSVEDLGSVPSADNSKAVAGISIETDVETTESIVSKAGVQDSNGNGQDMYLTGTNMAKEADDVAGITVISITNEADNTVVTAKSMAPNDATGPASSNVSVTPDIDEGLPSFMTGNVVRYLRGVSTAAEWQQMLHQFFLFEKESPRTGVRFYVQLFIQN